MVVLSRVSHNLWVGDEEAASSLPMLKALHIRTIVSVVSYGFSSICSPGITQYSFAVDDTAEFFLLDVLEEAIQVIADSLAIGGVLVHW